MPPKSQKSRSPREGSLNRDSSSNDKKERKAPEVAPRRSKRLQGVNPDTQPIGKKTKAANGAKSRSTENEISAPPPKKQKSKRPPDSKPDGAPQPKKKKKKKTITGTEAPHVQDKQTVAPKPAQPSNSGTKQGTLLPEPTIQFGPDTSAVSPKGKKPKGKPKGILNGKPSSTKPRAAEAHPELSDNLRRRLCSLWRSDSNVIASLSDLQVHHSREHTDDEHGRRMLSERTIMLAIAALWQGLAGADIPYSFGNGQLFANTRTENGLREGNRCVPASDILLMPLFFWNSIENPSKDDEGNQLQTGQPGHGLIAVAQEDADLNITFTFMYSRPRDTTKPESQRDEEVVDGALVRQTAQEVVRRSGWLPENEDPQYNNDGDTWLEVPPAFAYETASGIGDELALENTLEQWNTMGHHMILNAWAFMLDISIEPEVPYVLAGGFDDPFYAITEELIDLALQGRVDGDVIKQFMTEFRYAKRETDKTAFHRIKDNNQLTRLRNERSVLINQTIFDRIIDHLQQDSLQGVIPRSRHLAANSQLQNQEAGVSIPTQVTEQVTTKHGPSMPTQDKVPASMKQQGQTWHAVLNHNLAIHEKAVKELGTTNDRLQAVKGHEYRDDLVWRAIMSVWWPLWESGHRYAFGTEEISTAMRNEEFAIGIQMWTVGNRQMPFIIPMRGHGEDFDHGNEYTSEDPLEVEGTEQNNGEKKGKEKVKGKEKGKEEEKSKEENKSVTHGGVGHWVLGIATFDEEVNRVDIRVLNSASRLGTNAIFRAAEAVCRLSGWLGLKKSTGTSGMLEPIPFTGTFKHIEDIVPQQKDGVHCGLHVVMSAWATMLNIPIRPNERFDEHSSRRFYHDGRRVINCALAGRMDTRTIQALLNAHGFSVEQDVNSEEDEVVRLDVMPDVSFVACNNAYDWGRAVTGTG